MEKIDGICREMQVHQEARKGFHWARKSKQPASKALRFWTKREENFDKFQDSFEIKISMENCIFSHFLLIISWISDSSPEVYTSGR